MNRRFILESATTALVLVSLGAILLYGELAGGDQEKIKSHEEVACNRCHAMVADIGGTVTERNLSGECLKCHQLKPVKYDSQTLTFHESTSPRCQKCHSFHTPNAIQASSRTIKAGSKSKSHLAHCLSCHQMGMKTSDLSTGHTEAVNFYHSNSRALAMLSPSEGCLVCHSSRGSRFTELKSDDNMPRFEHMATHPYGVAFHEFIQRVDSDGNKVESFRPLLIDDRIECQTCHTLTNRSADYLAGDGEYGDLCQACHDQ